MEADLTASTLNQNKAPRSKSDNPLRAGVLELRASFPGEDGDGVVRVLYYRAVGPAGW